MLFASSTPMVVVHVASSGPNWLVFALTQLGSFLAGTATALVVQLYVVPDAETRKRRAQRWEEEVRQLSDVLATSLSEAATNAWAAQKLYREERERTSDEYNPAVVRHQAKDVQDSTLAFGSVIRTQVDRLIGRVIRFNPGDEEIKRLKSLNGDYQMRAILVPDHDKRTDAEFEEGWGKERDAREALIKQVQVLESMSPPSPPKRPHFPAAARRQKSLPSTESGRWHGVMGPPDP